MQKFQETHLRHMGREYVFCLKTSWDFPLISGDILEQFLSHHHILSSEEEVSTAQAPSFREETGIAGGVIFTDERDIYSLFLNTFEPFTLIWNTFL